MKPRQRRHSPADEPGLFGETRGGATEAAQPHTSLDFDFAHNRGLVSSSKGSQQVITEKSSETFCCTSGTAAGDIC